MEDINAIQSEIASLEAEILAEEARLRADGYLPEDEIERRNIEQS